MPAAPDQKAGRRGDTRPLSGRVALVTGASRGLGRALVLRFAREGAAVVASARGADDLEAVARELRHQGADVLAHPLDVSDANGVATLIGEVARWHGRLDVLVNNASLLGSRGPLAAQDVTEWRRVLDVNLTGSFLLTRAALPMLREARGSVINVSSGVGNRPRRDWGAYAVSKRALEAFSENLAIEESAVRVNVVDPGGMRTAMRAAAYPDEDPDTLPEPAEVTDVFAWLAGDASRGTTGQRFVAREWHASQSNRGGAV